MVQLLQGFSNEQNGKESATTKHEHRNMINVKIVCNMKL